MASPKVVSDFGACGSLEELQLAVAGCDLDLKATLRRWCLRMATPHQKLCLLAKPRGLMKTAKASLLSGLAGSYLIKCWHLLAWCAKYLYHQYDIMASSGQSYAY